MLRRLALSLLALTTLVGGGSMVVALPASAAEQTWLFVPDANCQVQQWTVPTSGTYSFEVAGGNGGGASGINGFGGVVTGNVYLSANSVVNLKVGTSGDAGTHCFAGSGNGTTDPNDLLAPRLGGGATTVSVFASTVFVAGGGGGAGRNGFGGGTGGLGATVEGAAATAGTGAAPTGAGAAGSSGSAGGPGAGGDGGALAASAADCDLAAQGGQGTAYAGQAGADGSGAFGGAPGGGPSTAITSNGSPIQAGGPGGGGGGGYTGGGGGGSGAYIACQYGPWTQGGGGGGGGAGTNFIATEGTWIPSATTRGARTDLDLGGYVRITLPLTAPTFTSPSSATFAKDAFASFFVQSSGSPSGGTQTLTGDLPPGMRFFMTNTPGQGLISGTPTATGTWTVSVKADNGYASTTQTITLKVVSTPSITSANATTFDPRSPGSFTVTASGTPAPSLSVAGTLPASLSFVDQGNGTATLSGTPLDGDSGSYPVTITADNGRSTQQNFTLTVSSSDGPTITTQPQSRTIAQGSDATFTVAATRATAYQWQRQQGADWVDVPGATSTTLTVTAPVPTVGVAYRVLVSNIFATVSSASATLVVRPTKLYVAPVADGGEDRSGANLCADAADPCATIQQAVDVGDPRMRIELLAGRSCSGWSNPTGKNVTIDMPVDSAPTAITGPVASVGGTTTLRGLTLKGSGSGTGLRACGGTAQLHEGRLTGWSIGIQAGGVGCGSSNGWASNTTVDGNDVGMEAAAGGAISIFAVTFVDNGKALAGPGSLTARVSVFSSNGSAACDAVTANHLDNWSDEGTCASGSQANRDDLGVFVVADAGGRTWSAVPRRNSPVVDSIPVANSYCGSRDQRGQARKVNNSNCDAGAVERQPGDRDPVTFTSPATATFVVGLNETFAVTTAGDDQPATLSATGLPSGLSLVDDGNGSGRILGTPAAGTAGDYQVTLTAANGAPVPATQTLNLAIVTSLGALPAAASYRGKPAVGALLSATTPSGLPDGAEVLYRWRIAGKLVSSAREFRPALNQAGGSLTLTVLVSAPGYTAGSATTEPVTIAASPAKVALSTTAPMRGTAFTLTGSGFPVGASYTITLDGKTLRGKANSSGRFSVKTSFAARSALGKRPVRVEAAIAGVSVYSKTFTVTVRR